jgi:2'-5' RNA ligase
MSSAEERRVRTFVAVNLSAGGRAALHSATEPLRRALGRSVSWVAEPALHVTVKFLGDRPDDFARRLAEGLAQRVERLRSTAIELRGVGAFPSLARPRVLWIGVAPNPVLSQLYHEVDTASAELGVPSEERPFHPHVTVGRVRDRARVDGTALAAAAAAVSFHAVERVSTVDIMESVLGPGGARYRVLSVVPLDDQEV